MTETRAKSRANAAALGANVTTVSQVKETNTTSTQTAPSNRGRARRTSDSSVPNTTTKRPRKNNNTNKKTTTAKEEHPTASDIGLGVDLSRLSVKTLKKYKKHYKLKTKHRTKHEMMPVLQKHFGALGSLKEGETIEEFVLALKTRAE